MQDTAPSLRAWWRAAKLVKLAEQAQPVHPGTWRLWPRLVPVVLRCRITSLLLLDAIVISLYPSCNAAEDEQKVDRVVTALAYNVKSPPNQ